MTVQMQTPVPGEDLVDEALAESFPASDPPSFTRGGNGNKVDTEEGPGGGHGWIKFAIPAGLLAAGVAALAILRLRERKAVRTTMSRITPK